MAVIAGIYGKTEPEYVGCVLSTYEHNGYNETACNLYKETKNGK